MALQVTLMSVNHPVARFLPVIPDTVKNVDPVVKEKVIVMLGNVRPD
jgi:hypothetical protein